MLDLVDSLKKHVENLILQKPALMQRKKMIQKPSGHIKTKFDKIGILLINLGTPENTIIGQ